MALPADLNLVAHGVQGNADVVVLKDPEEDAPLYFTNPAQVYRFITCLHALVESVLALSLSHEDQACIQYNEDDGYYWSAPERKEG